jgi:hypothetical protein
VKLNIAKSIFMTVDILACLNRMSIESFGEYVNKVGGAFVGKTEGFYDASGSSVNFAMIGAMSLFAVIITFVVLFANCYGAARLSWCYNTFYGVGGAERLLWSFLCFFFSGIYYPVYAIFLDPVCGRVAQRGGSRKL